MGRQQYSAPDWDVLSDCGLGSCRENCAILGPSTSRMKSENACGSMLFVAENNCGIFNPVIMLQKMKVEKFSYQLRKYY